MSRLAAVRTVANANAVIYTPTVSKQGVITLSVCNINSTTIKVKIAVTSNSDTTVSAGEYIEFDFEISPNNTYERTGIVLANPQSIVVNSSSPVDCVVWGFED